MSNRLLATRLRRRTLRRARRRFPELAVLFVIAVTGVALGGAFFTGSSSVLQSLDRFWDRGSLQHGYFAGPQENLDDLDDGVEGIEQMRSVDVELASGVGDDVTVRLFPPRQELNLHEVTSGRDAEASGEVVLDEKLAAAHGLGVGTKVEIDGRGYELVGTATAPEYVTTKNSQMVLQPNPDDFGMGFVIADEFDEHFGDHPHPIFAYDDRHTPTEIVQRFDPLEIRDTGNDSRIQQAIGDSTAPRDLAALIFVIFTAITTALLAVYHFETRRREAGNQRVFALLGHDAVLRGHYRTETTVTLVAAWCVAMVIILVAVRPIMSINGQLYNYPRLEVHWPTLVAVGLVSLVLLVGLDLLIHALMNRRQGTGGTCRTVLRARRTRAAHRATPAPRPRRVTTAALGWIPDFGYRLRTVKVLRGPGELLSLTVLVLIVGLFVNFSFMLKASVDSWVGALAEDTPYAHMYSLPQGTAESLGLREVDEAGTVATLYDDDGIAQMVFEISKDSRYFGALDGPAVTTAFAEKFGIGPGDPLELSEIDGGPGYTMDVQTLVDNGTSAMVYVPEDHGQRIFGADLPRADVVFSREPHPDLDGEVPVVTRDQVVSSGESITRIIGMQVALLLGVSALLMAVMLFSIYRFTVGNQLAFIRTMKRNGYTAGLLLRALFGYTVLAAVITVAVSYVASIGMVRAFFDQIMFKFVNFVPADGSLWIPSVTIGGSLLLLGVMLTAAYRSLRSTRHEHRR